MRLKPLVLARLLLLLAAMNSAFLHGQNPGRVPRSPNQAPLPGEQQERERLEKEMAKRVNQERQAQLKRDTDRLLKLATELKDYVDKSNENTLSLPVVKKAEEIEKLAHSVKEKMKGQ